MLIGIAGYRKSGKDTMGNYLAENHGFRTHAFAKPLKDVVGQIFDFTTEQLYGDLKETPDTRYLFSKKCVICGHDCIRGNVADSTSQTTVMGWFCPACPWTYEHNHVTPRLAMQTLGTEWGRRLTPNIWIDACLNDIRQQDHKKWAITDVRFRNEVQAVQDAGGLVVRLLRGELAFEHQSEKELSEMSVSEFDYVIDNNSTLEEFYQKIDEALPRLELHSP